MIRSRDALVGLFVAVFLLRLLVTLPASLLGATLRSASQGRLELANCNGTLWHGSAIPILHRQDMNDGSLLLDHLEWDVSIASLFTLQPRIELNWPDAKQPRPVDVSISLRQLKITNLYLPLPASMIGEFSPYLRPIGLGGRVIVKSDSVSVTTHDMQGTLVADWIGASSALSSVSPLGDYRLVIKGAGSGADVTLDTTSGKLILKGSGHLDAAGALKFSGNAQAAEGQEEKLRELLLHLGPQIAPGRHAFYLGAI